MQDEGSETQIGILGKFLLEILHGGHFLLNIFSVLLHKPE